MWQPSLAVFLTVTVSVWRMSVCSRQTEYEQPYYSHNNGGLYDTDGYMSSMEWGGAGGGLGSEKNCIDIPENMTLCKDIGYNQMRIPNLLDHDTVREVTQQAGSWVPLLGIRCHPDTKLFLCSLFSPVCLDQPIWPCRTLCEAVKNGCESLMLKYGFPWPEMLRCDKFPPDNDLCMGLQHDNQPVEATLPPPIDNICPACKHPDTFEAIADNFCSADFVLRIRVDDVVISGSDLKINVYRKMKKIKKGSLKKRDTRDMLLYVTDGDSCECNHVTQSRQGNGKRDKTKYLVMGSRQGDKLVVQYLAPVDMSKPDFKKAWKAMKKNNLCGANGLPSLPISESSGSRGRKNNNRRNNGPKSNRKNNNKDQESPGGNGDKNPADTSGNTELRRRKHCKNPKKCISTAAAADQEQQQQQQPQPASKENSRNDRDRSNRRGGPRRERNRGNN